MLKLLRKTFNEQLITIQNQARLQAIEDESELIMHTVTLGEITLSDITPEIYPS